MRRVTEDHPVSIEELHELAGGRFGDMVKGVVDLGRGVMLIDADMHADQEAELLAEGAVQRDLWGINLYPVDHGSDGWIEFDSMINVRPKQGNRTRSVEDEHVRRRIVEIVERLVAP
jgi:hypothetical protein